MQAISVSRTSYCIITVFMHFVVSVHFFVVLICTNFVMHHSQYSYLKFIFYFLFILIYPYKSPHLNTSVCAATFAQAHHGTSSHLGFERGAALA